MTNTLPAPLDVKLMNMVAAALYLGCAATALAALAAWVLRSPAFAISGITVRGEVSHNSAATLRANVAPRLEGNFFTLDLARTRAAFEAVPWVRHAVVRREFPNRLEVTLQEHQPVAYWGNEAEARLLNSFGELFEANTGDIESEELPYLSGPDAQAPQVLAMYRLLQPLFAPLDATLETLTLSSGGGWHALLDSGAAIELGRGAPEDVAARVRRFAATLNQVTSRYGRKPDALESADLRHGDGYALRLRGVTTTVATEVAGLRQ